MRSALSIILNLPWTILGLLFGLISLPVSISLSTSPIAVVIKVKSFWWYSWLPGQKGARAMAVGNSVLMGPKVLANDLEHELVHVAQSMREPLIHPFLYQIENVRHGYRKNKYEMEAYAKAGNAYVHRMSLQPSPFGKIKGGSKSIEIRLNDEKRQLINIGDEIIFTLATNELESIRTKVTQLSKFLTFKELCMAFPPERYGSKSQDEYADMYKYYSREDEEKYGVLAIEVKYLAS